MAGHLYVSPGELMHALKSNSRAAPWLFWPPLLVTLLLIGCICIYTFLHLVSPVPRPSRPSEKFYITTTPHGTTSIPQRLPNWYDNHQLHCKIADSLVDEDPGKKLVARERAKAYIEKADVAMSVIIPAFNEEKRLVGMLEEAVGYLDGAYGRPGVNVVEVEMEGEEGKLSPEHFNENGTRRRRVASHFPSSKSKSKEKEKDTATEAKGYEILLVSDGSTDATVEVALEFSHKHALHDVLRIVKLEKNRGKGGAVCHGLRHVGGEYAVFADADGASRFGDLGKLVEGCKGVEDGMGRGVAVGSRAHLVGSEAVVKRSALRNTLMHSFHLLLRLLTPPATSRIRDTQCGFKLFSRNALPFIIPYMHAEGWIFDVEMLMLAESSPPCSFSLSESSDGKAGGRGKGRGRGIQVSEVPIAWNEVGGSKLNVMWDSLGMAWGLAVLRGAWMLGVYKR